ncbi:GATA-type zinc finger protein 1 [Aquila chrysaetos chrysaetos]|uniref:GATA-type zinc finger protein 1 n=1 Tax=Aquila chrysaetos chrysaetos TaxID=223781 RepID=UPI0011768718|nr:GATA-type zinc finger protein 1 [Aquila chrysaetos chrysaetos]
MHPWAALSVRPSAPPGIPGTWAVSSVCPAAPSLPASPFPPGQTPRPPSLAMAPGDLAAPEGGPHSWGGGIPIPGGGYPHSRGVPALPLTPLSRRDPSRSRGSSPPARPPGAGSSSEDDVPPTQGSKRCASCKTRRTPLWRAAENGTPLCNACGIRYKKYRVRCRRCWNIPGKSGTPRPQCPHCGEQCRPAGGGRR